MKVITSPVAITINLGDRAVTHEFKKFLVEAIDLHQPAGRTIKMIRQAAKIVDVIEGSNGTIKLEDADYELLKSALDSVAWNPAVARRLLPFFDAVEGAT